MIVTKALCMLMSRWKTGRESYSSILFVLQFLSFAVTSTTWWPALHDDQHYMMTSTAWWPALHDDEHFMMTSTAW
jgi:hypothetical protein